MFWPDSFGILFQNPNRMITLKQSATLFNSLILAATLQLTGVAGLHAQNLVTNSDFAGGSSTGWSTSSSIEINPQTTYGGPSSSIYVTEIDVERTINQQVCILPGLTYTFTYQATRRPQTGTPANPGMVVKVTGTTSNTNYVNSTQLYGGTTWNPQTKTFSITVPANSTDKRLNIQFSSTNNSTTYGVIIWDIELAPAAGSPLSISGPSSSAVAVLNSYSLTNAPASTSYNWSFSGGGSPGSSTNANPSVSWASTGSKTVSVAVSNGVCTMATYTKTVSVQIPLPVDITGFSGTMAGNNAQLTWVSEKETGGRYFVVERSSNGIDFDSIGVVSSKNAQMAYTYQYTDRSMSVGNNYYRLRHVDLDNAVYYSKTIVLNNAVASNSGNMQVYPNPAAATLNYRITSEKAGTVILQVYNTAGVMVLSSRVQLSTGISQQSINIAQLNNGNYFLKLADAQGAFQYTQTFVKL